MKVTVKSKKGLDTELKVFVDKTSMNKKIDDKLLEIKNKVTLKGFRPGKAPVELLKSQFGKSIYGEVLDQVLKETSKKAIEDQKIKLAVQPKIDLKSYGENKDLEYLLKIEELPKINIDNISNIKINDYEIKISENDIEKKIKEIAKNQNNFKDKLDNEVSNQGDLIIFNYKATVEGKDFKGNSGENVQLILGKDLFIKGFDKQLIGKKKKQSVSVEVSLPENYPIKELSKKKANFTCQITNIRKPKPVEINENFAKSLGAKNLADLKEMLKKQTKLEFQNTLDSMTKKQILNQLEKFKDFDIPKSLIDQELSIITENMKENEKEKNKKENEKNAIKRIKIGLILNEFGEKNKIVVNEDEIKNEIQKQVASMPAQSKQILEFYQKNQSAVASLRGNIYEDKILDLIKQKSKKNKKTLTTSEAEKIIIGEINQTQPAKKAKTKTSKKKK